MEENRSQADGSIGASLEIIGSSAIFERSVICRLLTMVDLNDHHVAEVHKCSLEGEGAACSSGLIIEGDELLTIDGQAISGFLLSEVMWEAARTH